MYAWCLSCVRLIWVKRDAQKVARCPHCGGTNLQCPPPADVELPIEILEDGLVEGPPHWLAVEGGSHHED